MKYNNYLGFLIFALFLNPACDGEEAVPRLKRSDLIEGIRIIDFGNSADASDIILLFNFPRPGEVDQVQVFINKGPDLSLIDREDVENVSPGRFFNLELSASSHEIRLPSSLVDLDGNPLEEEQEYSLGFLITRAGEISLNEEAGTFILKREHYLTGDYIGTWDDNLYTAFGISSRISLSLSGGRASGDFFYSNNFSSCCEGDNDGNISFKLAEDGSLEDFIYRQDLANFQGGACPGTYNGSGRLENYTILILDFEGNDCEGPHTGGRIRLQKQL